jgi:signal transduction histidine kinase
MVVAPLHESRNTQVLLAAVPGLIVGVVWLALSLWFLHNFKRADAIRFKVNRVRIELLEARRREKDFLLRSLTDPAFYERGQSQYLDLHAEAMGRLRRDTDELAQMVSPERRDDMRRLRGLLDEYEQNFQALVGAYRRRGFHDSGLEGDWRKSIRTLQQAFEQVGNLTLQRELLEMRKDEKDFLLRGDVRHLQGVRRSLDRLREDVPRLVPEQAAALLTELNRFEHDLDAYHAIQEEIGLNEDLGLQGRFRTAAHAVEPLVEAVYAEEVVAQEAAGRRLTVGLILASILLTLLLTTTFSLTATARSHARQVEQSNRSLVEQSTELAQVNQDLRAATTELARSNNELQQFAYVASHDLQEPLRAVTGCIQLLQERCRDRLDAQGDELIGHVVDGAARMQALIDDLLALSRVGTSARAFVGTDLEIVLRDVRTNLAPALKESGATLTNTPLPTIVADPPQMAQLFQNLIGNALKFRGERSPTIQIGAERQEGRWLFSVKDNGIGIEPQYYERIFLLFQRLHTRRSYTGTGIGLAICKKIVERHGGRIWVESVPDQGSAFYFTIPDRTAP